MEPLGFLLTLIAISIAGFFGLRTLIKKKKAYLPPVILFVLLVIFLLLLLLWILSLFLSKNDIYIRGYRSMSFLFIGMAFFGFVYFLFLPEKPKMFTPLFGLRIIVLVAFGLAVIHAYVVCEEYKRLLYYTDKNYRLEKPITFINKICLPDLFIKDGLLERKYKLEHGLTSDCLSKGEITAVSIVKKDSKTIEISFFHHNDTARAYLPNPVVRIVHLK